MNGRYTVSGVEIDVISHDGYRGNERPRAVMFCGERLEVREIEDAWISTGVARDSEIVRGFRVRCAGGARFKLTFTDGNGWQGERLPGPYALRET